MVVDEPQTRKQNSDPIVQGVPPSTDKPSQLPSSQPDAPKPVIQSNTTPQPSTLADSVAKSAAFERGVESRPTPLSTANIATDAADAAATIILSALALDDADIFAASVISDALSAVVASQAQIPPPMTQPLAQSHLPKAHEPLLASHVEYGLLVRAESRGLPPGISITTHCGVPTNRLDRLDHLDRLDRLDAKERKEQQLLKRERESADDARRAIELTIPAEAATAAASIISQALELAKSPPPAAPARRPSLLDAVAGWFSGILGQ